MWAVAAVCRTLDAVRSVRDALIGLLSGLRRPWRAIAQAPIGAAEGTILNGDRGITTAEASGAEPAEGW
jgi:hypothetical protein